jgi:hypothetical protein
MASAVENTCHPVSPACHPRHICWPTKRQTPEHDSDFILISLEDAEVKEGETFPHRGRGMSIKSVIIFGWLVIASTQHPQDDSVMVCDTCGMEVKVGTAGTANLEQHKKSKYHQEAVGKAERKQ